MLSATTDGRSPRDDASPSLHSIYGMTACQHAEIAWRDATAVKPSQQLQQRHDHDLHWQTKRPITIETVVMAGYSRTNRHMTMSLRVRAVYLYIHAIETVNVKSHLRCHRLSLPQSFSRDLKLISFTNPFLHSLPGSIWTAFVHTQLFSPR